MTDHILNQILDKSRTARAASFNVLSTGEKLTIGLVLNRADWLAKMDYTMAEAIERAAALTMPGPIACEAEGASAKGVRS